MQVSRRRALATAGAGIAAATVLRRARAADPIKTAAIYTVPIEQQWVSRIHLAANTAKDRGDIEYVFSESVANTDYERVMREYAEAGHKLIIGEAFAVEDAARARLRTVAAAMPAPAVANALRLETCMEPSPCSVSVLLRGAVRRASCKAA